MARAPVLVAIALAGCGLLSKDFDVSQDFPAGGGAPPFTGTFSGDALTGQLSNDLNKISSITLAAARIESIDGGDVAFVSSAKISISGKVLPAALIAQLAAPAPAGATSVQLEVDSAKELKPYLQADGAVTGSIDYAPTPTAQRKLRLVLTLRGSLL